VRSWRDWPKTTNSNPGISPRSYPSAAVSRLKPLHGSLPPPIAPNNNSGASAGKPNNSRAKACSIGSQRSVFRQFGITDTDQSRISALSPTLSASNEDGFRGLAVAHKSAVKIWTIPPSICPARIFFSVMSSNLDILDSN